MAFDSVTFFEVHVGERAAEKATEQATGDGKQSGGGQSKKGGSKKGGSKKGGSKKEGSKKEQSGGGLPVKGLVAATVLLAGAALAVKKFRGGGGKPDIETEPVEPGVEVERPEA